MSYTPFKKMTKKLAARPGVYDPAGLSAYLARKKYGKQAVQRAAAHGSSLKGHKVVRKASR